MLLVDSAARMYWEELGFAEPLRDMLGGSLNEACEEFIRVCRERGIEETFEVTLDFLDGAAIIRLSYDSRVPLNPLETEEYEVPASPDDLDSLNMDSLWLHLIKRRMDRVFFRVEGSRRCLQMMKYRREEGKARQLWVMGLSPRLRSGLKLELEPAGAESSIVRGGLLLDDRSGAALKLDPGSAFIVQRLDGKTTFHDIYLEYIDRVGMVSPKQLALLFERLEAQNMLERESAPERGGRFRRLAQRVINPGFVIPQADRFIGRLQKSLSFLLNPFGAALFLLAGFSGLIPLWREGAGELFRTGMELKPFFLSHSWAIGGMYVLLLASAAAHELGHAVVCRTYGGRVDRVGVMFYLAMFIFFCDTSSAWNFSRKGKKIAVSLAGPLVTFAFLGAGLWAWGWQAGAGSAVEMIAAAFSLLTMFTLAMNLNPFIRMDAYYVLMDLSGIRNLRSRSFAYMRDILSELLLGKRPDPAEPKASFREKIYFLVYGVSGGIMSVVFFCWPLVYYIRRFIASNGASGGAFLFGAIIALILIRLGVQGFRKFYSFRNRAYKIV
jgi:putative peptide zinc metalloprotease protein